MGTRPPCTPSVAWPAGGYATYWRAVLKPLSSSAIGPVGGFEGGNASVRQGNSAPEVGSCQQGDLCDYGMLTYLARLRNAEELLTCSLSGSFAAKSRATLSGRPTPFTLRGVMSS